MELTFLSSGNALRDFRKEQYEKQGGICPIFKIWIPFEDSVVDHLHGLKNDPAGKNNAHMVRGIIHNAANAAEGTITSICKRRGIEKFMPIPDYLRSLADYIENPPLFGSGYVHPAGKPKTKTIGRRDFNRIKKYWSQIYPRRKPPVWKDKMKKGKKTGQMNLTKQLEEALWMANEIHYG